MIKSIAASTRKEISLREHGSGSSLPTRIDPFPPRVTVTGDLLPRVRGIHEGRVVDLVVDVLVFVERKRPTQAHVHDDADGPHVERAVVALV